MVKRGRKPILEDRRTTCVTLEGRHIDFLKENGIEASEFLRDNIEALMKNKSSPIERMKKEIEDRKAVILENEMAINILEMEIKKLEEQKAKEEEEGRLLDEFEDKRREYVKGCIKSIQTQNSYNRIWMEYLLDAWKFQDFDEAKEYVKNVWIEEGVPEKKVKNYLRLN